MASQFAAWMQEPRPARPKGVAIALAVALLAPTLIWAFALYFDYGAASHACFPSSAPRASLLPGWGRLPLVLVLLNLVSFLTVVAGLALALAEWRRAARRAGAAPTTQIERPLAATTRSLSAAALMAAGVLCFGVAVNGVSLWLVSNCALA